MDCSFGVNSNDINLNRSIGNPASSSASLAAADLADSPGSI